MEEQEVRPVETTGRRMLASEKEKLYSARRFGEMGNPLQSSYLVSGKQATWESGA